MLIYYYTMIIYVIKTFWELLLKNKRFKNKNKIRANSYYILKEKDCINTWLFLKYMNHVLPDSEL